jgi:hypothetical protein
LKEGQYDGIDERIQRIKRNHNVITILVSLWAFLGYAADHHDTKEVSEWPRRKQIIARFQEEVWRLQFQREEVKKTISTENE